MLIIWHDPVDKKRVNILEDEYSLTWVNTLGILRLGSKDSYTRVEMTVEAAKRIAEFYREYGYQFDTHRRYEKVSEKPKEIKTNIIKFPLRRIS
jgi:hypothetical protein